MPIQNDVCINQMDNVMLDSYQRRVVPFMNPQIIYDKTVGSHSYQKNNCVIPSEALSYFKLDSTCIFNNSDINLAKTKDDEFPTEGCVVSSDKLQAAGKTMANNLDDYYITQIRLLTQKRDQLRSKLEGLKKTCYMKGKHIDSINRGLDLANNNMQSWNIFLSDYANKPIVKGYNAWKKAYQSLVDTFNKRVDEVNNWIHRCNTSLNFAIIFEHCDFGGAQMVLKMGPNESRKTFTLGPLTRQVSSLKVPPGLKLYLTGDDGWMWATNYIAGTRLLRNWGYEGKCLVDLDFNDQAVDATLVRENEFKNFAWLKAIREFNEESTNWPNIFDVDSIINNGQWDKNKDRPGHDFEVRKTETALECAKACAVDTRCYAMSWDTNGAKTCWLKNNEGRLRDSNERESWKKSLSLR